MKAFSFLFFAVSSVAFAGPAKKTKPASTPTPRCLSISHKPFAPDDHFDEIVVFKEGPFKGCQADTSSKRSIVALSDADARLVLGDDYSKLTPTTRVFANLRADTGSQFWVATLDTALVDRLIFQTEVFQKGKDTPGINKLPFKGARELAVAAHSQIRLVMKPDACIQLYSQLKSELGAKGPCLKNVVYSVEAMKSVDSDVSFDLVKGTKKHFMLAHTVIRLSDKAKYMIGQDHQVFQIELKLSPAEIQKVADAMIEQGTSPYRITTYHTTRASCTTEIYAILDDVIFGKRAPVRSFLKNKLLLGLDAVPIAPNTYLRYRGLVGQRLKNLEVEFGKTDAELNAIP